VGYGESGVPEHRSFSDALRGWASREDGVYATEDGGGSWRLIYPRSALRVARVSALTGMVALGDRVSACGCRQVRRWTADGGATWHRTTEGDGNGFVGASGTFWWWRGGRLFRAAEWPPGPKGLMRQLVANLPGAIVDVAAVPEGVAVLTTSRVAGVGADGSPLLLVVQGAGVRYVRLPRVTGDVLTRSIETAWPRLTVRAFDVTAFTRGERGAVTWSSPDGGTTWAVTRE
jgi:hypothetical protein